MEAQLENFVNQIGGEFSVNVLTFIDGDQVIGFQYTGSDGLDPLFYPKLVTKKGDKFFFTSIYDLYEEPFIHVNGLAVKFHSSAKHEIIEEYVLSLGYQLPGMKRPTPVLKIFTGNQ